MFTVLPQPRMRDEAHSHTASSHFDSASAHFKVVEGYARFFTRPEVRLRFLNHTLALHAKRSARLEETLGRWRFLRKLPLYQRFLSLSLYGLIFGEVARLLPSDSGGKHGLLGLHRQAPLSARVFYRCYKFRRTLYALSAVACLALCFAGYRGASWTLGRANQYLAGRYKMVELVYAGEKAGVAPGLAERLPSYQPSPCSTIQTFSGW
jgi:hypothetical protein